MAALPTAGVRAAVEDHGAPGFATPGYRFVGLAFIASTTSRFLRASA